MKPDRIVYFQLWCLQTVVLEKTLESPLDSKEIKPINLKGNQPWIPLEGLMLKLKRQYFSHLMQTTDSLEKSLSLGKIEGRKRRGLKGWDGWMASLMQWTWTWANLGRWWGKEAWCAAVHRVGQDWMSKQQHGCNIFYMWWTHKN